jgi:hypothetical protein
LLSRPSDEHSNQDNGEGHGHPVLERAIWWLGALSRSVSGLLLRP